MQRRAAVKEYPFRLRFAPSRRNTSLVGFETAGTRIGSSGPQPGLRHPGHRIDPGAKTHFTLIGVSFNPLSS